ncbi:MAG: hypothetical protein M1438_18240, partial [Deltaproteobacteria bacterium]|nr:hypothetical protein [Deltaproteobacteria bacterium]
MKHRRLLGFMAMALILAACSTPMQEQDYLHQYGYKGGRGQGYRKLPYYVSQEPHTCVQGKISGRITRLRPETFSQDM